MKDKKYIQYVEDGRLEGNKQKVQYWHQRLNTAYSSKNNYISTKTHNVYGPWQPSNWLVSGNEILSTKGLSWWYGVHWKAGRTGQHMKNDEVTRESIRQTIAGKLGFSTECIILDPQINARGNTPTIHTGIGDAIMFSSYNIGYQYRTLEVKTESYFDQAKYDADIKYCQGQINYYKDSVEKGELAKKQYEDMLAKQKQEELIAKQKQEAILKKQKEEKAIIDNIKSIDAKERSILLSKVFNKTDANSKFTVNEIKKTCNGGGGFDAGYLCYLAILEGKEGLFDLSLQHIAGGSFISHIYTVNEKTLLQHIINSNNQIFLHKALSKCNDEDISDLTIHSLNTNNTQTLNKLIEFQPELFQKKYSGFTILQQVLNKGVVNIPLIEQIIILDNDLSSVLASNGESTFKISIKIFKNTSPETIKLISNYINIKTELDQLPDIELGLKEKIIEKSDIDTLIRLLSGEEISLEQYMLENLELAEENDDVQIDDLLFEDANDVDKGIGNVQYKLNEMGEYIPFYDDNI